MQTTSGASTTSLTLRDATAADAALILEFIRELAEYEREPDAVVTTEADLVRDGFGPEPRFHVVIAEWEGEPAAFAFYFFNYSTWRGRIGLYLEDLFVRPTFRGRNIGTALLAHLARIAVEKQCYGMRWQVLDWNEPAIGFYRSLGARPQDTWTVYRLTGDALEELAGSAG